MSDFLYLSTYPEEGSQNVGDFLIGHSVETIIKHTKSNSSVHHRFQESHLEHELDYINSLDGILSLPPIRHSTWPNILRLVDDLDRITPRIIPVGAGSLRNARSLSQARNTTLDEGTRRLLDRMQRDCASIPCRESFTQTELSRAGYRTHLQGDPALFDPDLIGSNSPLPHDVSTIAFTPPRKQALAFQASLFLESIMTILPQAEISIIAHGVPNPAEREFAQRNSLPVVAAYGSDVKLLHAHLDFDLHVGYRVHAHLYRRRIRIPSILLAEDSRALGFNELLGEPVFSRPIGIGLRGSSRLLHAAPILDGIFRSSNSTKAFESFLAYEIDHGWPSVLSASERIDELWAESVEPFYANL